MTGKITHPTELQKAANRAALGAIAEKCAPLYAGPIPCPYVYKDGRRCTGHITHVEAYKADLCWSPDKKTGKWTLHAGQPRSHYHLFCSEKDNHAGVRRPDSERMKFYYDQLPPELQKIISEA